MTENRATRQSWRFLVLAAITGIILCWNHASAYDMSGATLKATETWSYNSVQAPLSGEAIFCAPPPTPYIGGGYIKITPASATSLNIASPLLGSYPVAFKLENVGDDDAEVWDLSNFPGKYDDMPSYFQYYDPWEDYPPEWNSDPALATPIAQLCDWDTLPPGGSCYLLVNLLTSGSENGMISGKMTVGWASAPDWDYVETEVLLAGTLSGFVPPPPPQCPGDPACPVIGEANAHLKIMKSTTTPWVGNPLGVTFTIVNDGDGPSTSISTTLSDSRFTFLENTCAGTTLPQNTSSEWWLGPTCRMIPKLVDGTELVRSMDVDLFATAVNGGKVQGTFTYTYTADNADPRPSIAPAAAASMNVVGPLPVDGPYAYGDWVDFTVTAPDRRYNDLALCNYTSPYLSTDPWNYGCALSTPGAVPYFFTGMTNAWVFSYDSDHFQVDSGTCASKMIASNYFDVGSCTFRVRPKANGNDSYSSQLQFVYQIQHFISNNPLTDTTFYKQLPPSLQATNATGTFLNYKKQYLVAQLSGTASGFVGPPPVPQPDPGLHVIPTTKTVSIPMTLNGDQTVSGDPTELTVSYYGDKPTASLAVSFENPADFRITDNQCSGTSLTNGQTCRFTVTPFSAMKTVYPPQSVVILISSSGDPSQYWNGFQRATILVNPHEVSGKAASLVLRPGSESWTIVNPNVYGDAKLFGLYNYGTGDSGVIRLNLDNVQNFEIMGDKCSGRSLDGLASGASENGADGCTFYIRTKTQSWSNVYRTNVVATDGVASAVSGLTLNTYQTCVSPCVPDDPENPSGTCTNPPCDTLTPELCGGYPCPEIPEDTPVNPEVCPLPPCTVEIEPPVFPCTNPPCDLPPDWPGMEKTCYPLLDIHVESPPSVDGKGKCRMQYGPCTSVFISNVGDCPTMPLQTGLSPTAFSGDRSYYNGSRWVVGGSGYKVDVISDKCAGTVLAPGEYCEVKVRPMAYRNVSSPMDSLTVSGFAPSGSSWVKSAGGLGEDSFNRISMRLGGSASNFSCDPYEPGPDIILDSSDPEAACGLASATTVRTNWLYVKGEKQCQPPDWVYSNNTANIKVMNVGETANSQGFNDYIEGDSDKIIIKTDSCAGQTLPGTPDMNPRGNCEIVLQGRDKYNETFAGRLHVIGGGCDNGAGGCHHNEIARATVFGSAYDFGESDDCCPTPPCKSICTGPRCDEDNDDNDDNDNDDDDNDDDKGIPYTCENNCRSCAGIAEWILHPWDAPPGALCCNCYCYCVQVCGPPVASDPWREFCRAGCQIYNCW